MTPTFPYVNNAPHHFDDRELRVIDDGSDFETFVYETLAIAGDQTSRLKPAHGRGRDGAIDLLDDTTAERCVIECKFIGCDSTSDGRHRWTDVYRNLNSNLIHLSSADAGRVVRSPYGPWLDQERPILKYVYCVTESFTNSNDEETLRKSIKNDFHTLSEAHPGLHHLKNIEVVVYGWNFFLAELARRLPLKYRWFGGLPLGLSPLFRPTPRSGPFKQFLNGETLPFFSRTRFHREQGRNKADTEEDLINALEQPDQDEVLILSGPGGVGKTRLALEIGRTLQQRGWLALMLSERASPQVIADIAKANSEPCRVVLILDYAEASTGIADLAEAIRSVNDAGHSFRLIATCRSSALPTVQDGLAELNSRLLVLDAVHTVEKTSFNEWVVTRILEHGGVPDPSKISLVCDGLPVLAAFAVYVFQRHKLAFETQLKNLVGEQGFSSWARHRLQILEDVFPSSSQPAKVLAELAFQLPITLPEASNIREQGGIAADLLERLKDDLWIEEHEATLVAAHDIFADAIAASYIFEAGRSAQDRAAAILRGALLKGHFERAVTCFIRLGTHPDFNKVDRLKIVKELFVTDEEKLLPHSNLLIRFGLLSRLEILTLLAEHPSLCARVTADSKCDMAVARLALYVNKILQKDVNNYDESRQVAVEVLTPLLDSVIARDASFSFLIGQALLLDRERYRALALDQLKLGARWLRTGMLIESWLRSDLPISGVKNEVSTWLSLFGESCVGAAFIYREWLAHRVDLSLVSPYIHKWLSKNGTLINAGIVFTALPHHSEDNDSVLKYYLPWLAVNYRQAVAGRVIGYWLQKGGDPESVKPYISVWLELHADRYSAGFVCKAWLEATSDYVQVQSHIQTWLTQFATNIYAADVLGTCIRVTKDYSQFGNAIGIWLQANHESPKAIDFCQVLLTNANDNNSLDGFLTALSISPNGYEAAVLYEAWLKQSSDPQHIQVALLCWLENHSCTQLAGNLYKCLAQTDTNLEPFYPYFRNWLTTHWGQQETSVIVRSWVVPHLRGRTLDKLLSHLDWQSSDYRSFILYESWIQQKGSRSSIELHLNAWLEEYQRDIQAGRLYKALLVKSKGEFLFDTYLDAWLELHADKNEAVPIYITWLNSKRDPTFIKRHLQTWLIAGHNIEQAGLVYRAWLEANSEITVIGNYLDEWIDRYKNNSNGRFIVQYLLDNLAHLKDYFSHPSNFKLRDYLENFVDDFGAGLKVGQIHTGRVTRILTFGVFIEFAGEEGLLHASQMSWEKNYVVPPQFTEIGSEINVQIIKINRGSRKISLSIRHLLPDPWKMIPSKYSVGEIVYGKVANKVDYGIFVELEPGIEGLLHKSKIPGAEAENLKSVYPIGSNINVRVTEVDEIHRRLALELYSPPEQTGQTETGN